MARFLADLAPVLVMWSWGSWAPDWSLRGTKPRQELLRKGGSGLGVKAGGAGGQADAHGLDQPAGAVDELGASADPARVGARLDREPGGREGGELPLQGGLGGGQTCFFD